LEAPVTAKDIVMSRTLLLLAASVALFSSAATFAQAADIIDPPVVELPEPMPAAQHAAKGGWYLRGDIGYVSNGDVDADYDVSGGTPTPTFFTKTLEGKLRSGYSVGAGIGYDTGNYLRMDLTADYFAKAKYSGSTGCTGFPVCTDDTTSLTALSLMANAYVDLGKFNGITPYVGAGIGGTHVKWDTLNNRCLPGTPAAECTTDTHPGAANWRFTYALMAGASYDVTDCVAIDAGYRYRKVEGGKTFGISSLGLSPAGYDKGIKSHEVRIGARYKFGGCGGSHVPDYQPDYQPVYK
jgi:opacity protein-like surface antigen